MQHARSYSPSLIMDPSPLAARQGHHLILLGCVLLGLAGCATPLPQRNAAIATPEPATWTNAALSGGTSSANSLAHWWHSFDDPLLVDLVTRTMVANPTVLRAQADLQQARAMRDVTLAGLLPELGGSASAQRSRTGDHDAANTFRLGLDARFDPDFFGARREAANASEAAVRIQAANLDSARLGGVVEVALLYIGLRADQERLRIANENLVSQLETQQITEWRLQAGPATSVEAEQWRAAVAQTRAQLPLLGSRVEQYRHSLAVLIGQPPTALASILATPRPIPRVAADLALSLPAETLRQRPDVRTAEHQVAAARAQLAQADAARLPSFRISGSLGLDALTLGGLGHGAAVVRAVLAGVSVPLFDGGAGRAQVRSQAAGLEAAHQTYRATVLTALKEVEDALVALRGDRERLQRLQTAAEAANTAAQLANLRYQSGLIDFQVVLETQRNQLASQDNVASADISADYVRLYKVLGGGWQPVGRDAESASTATLRTPRS